MSGSNNQTSSDNEGDDEFPIAAIVCISVGAYLIIIIVIIIIKQMLNSRGSCKSECCQPEEGSTRTCCSCAFCAKAGECCTCCGGCHVNGCLTKICGKPKRTNCVDILMCNCGGCTERCCTGCDCSCGCSCIQKASCCTCCSSSGPSFSCKDFCGDLLCCGASDAGACACLCLEVKLRSPRPGSLRRSHSVPPFKDDEVKQFNTHYPPSRAGGDFRKSSEVTKRPTTNLRTRSSSLSPSKVKWPSRDENNLTKVSTDGFEIISNHSDSSCVHLNHNNSGKSSINSRTASNNVNNNNNIGKTETFRNSRRRKSLRAGQQSQRFPHKVLVSRESVKMGEDRLQSASNQNVKCHSTPVQSSVSRRPLPPLKNVSHQTKFSKTS